MKPFLTRFLGSLIMTIAALLSVTIAQPAAAVLATNDLMVIAYNSETAAGDTVALLATVDIPNGTTIHLTDRGWQASPLGLRPTSGLENNILWITSGVTAGKIIRIATGEPDTTVITGGVSITPASFIGTSYGTVSGSINFDPGTGDQLLIYTTADNLPDSTPTFIHAFNADNPSGVVAANDDGPFDGWSDDVGPSNTTSACRLPPGLTAVTTTGNGGGAFGLASYHALLEQDNYIYSGPTSQATRAAWIARITTFANWSADDTTPYNTQTQGSLNGFLAYQIGGQAPTISNVTSTKTNGAYGVTSLIPVTITFNTPVTVTGAPTLALNSGGTATYASGSPGTDLIFNYTVGSAQNAADLDYTATNSLTLASGTINGTSGGAAATLTLPSPGTAGSLGANKALVIDTTAPTILSINRQTPSGQTTGSSTVTFRVTYAEAVTGITNSSFAVVPVSSTIVGTVTGVSVVNPTTCDVNVNITSGTGEYRLRGVN